MLGGYKGKILWVDLANHKWHTEKITEDLAFKWIGGSGFAAVIVSKLVSDYTDPLGPDNILGFFTGPLTGTMVPSSGRHCVAGKSPLTGIWGEASVGGSWGKCLKDAGYDALILTGQSPYPVYLWINEEKIEIRRADSLWGLDTYQIEEAVRELTHPKAQVLSIGPAGEKLVKISGIFTDGIEGRTAARCGLGAVAGSKRVKAIAVYGQKRTVLFKKEELQQKIRDIMPKFVEKTKGQSNYGTPGLVIPCEQTGDFPVKNWTLGSWEEGAKKINGVVMAEKYLIGRFHCSSCPIGCGRRIAITEGKYAGVRGGGPEYETLGLFGGSCMIDDLEAISYANELCNRYGIDTIDTGNMIAFSMEAYEKGIINKQDTGGLEIKWGDKDVLIELIREIGENRGYGAILAQGIPALITQYGEAAKDMCMMVKGLGFPSHEPRAYNSTALGYATANRGACHLEAFSHSFERSLSMPELGIEKPLDRFSSERKGELVAKAQNLMMLFDSLAICKLTLFGGINITILAHWLSLATGISWTADELIKCGERIFNMKRLFDIKCGINRKDDILPERILKQPRGSGGAAENLPPLEKMLDEYYSYRGWDANGIPTKQKLLELEIYKEA